MDKVILHFEDFNFTHHFKARYSASGDPYSMYEFAYRFGYELAVYPQYEDEGWLVVESYARRQ